ncbi:hypothetical protein VHEMI08499 [[Torrubiella] hemipterigena]|uniref:Uncharacterized protein n=1 Tax=[Torrubiella] hemipterigena TaxID=1531966 RepID=A0A0A1T6W5_9HYPO|nr:hypothetical protein VHEMI08499 [[Torrubiella] hemipterigena]
MKFAVPVILALVSAAQATQVNWEICNGGVEKTNSDGCTNVSGAKEDNLCGITIPPPGTDYCEFYTTGCGNPFGSTYRCSVSDGHCNARSWKSIASYRCWDH